MDVNKTIYDHEFSICRVEIQIPFLIKIIGNRIWGEIIIL